MPIVGVSKETKAKLLAAARDGQGIELWLFQFICTDWEFQSELFKTAEDCQNWNFLECLSQYRAQQRNKLAATIALSQNRPKPGKKLSQNHKPAAPTGRKEKTNNKGKRTQIIPDHKKVDPHRLPAGQVVRVTSNAFTKCPRCGLRLLTIVLRDHLELACKFRGRIDNWKSSNGVPWSGPSYDDHWKS